MSLTLEYLTSRRLVYSWSTHTQIQGEIAFCDKSKTAIVARFRKTAEWRRSIVFWKRIVFPAVEIGFHPITYCDEIWRQLFNFFVSAFEKIVNFDRNMICNMERVGVFFFDVGFSSLELLKSVVNIRKRRSSAFWLFSISVFCYRSKKKKKQEICNFVWYKMAKFYTESLWKLIQCKFSIW